MSKLAPARRAALDVLCACRRRSAHARELLRSSEAVEALDPRDRALATRLVLGCVGALGALDAALDTYLKKLSKVEPRVRDALRIAAFELMYLSTDSAVCVSQGVELVRSVLPQAAGMANAVLRRVGENERPRVAAARERLRAGDVDEESLALAGGLPVWLAHEYLVSMGVGKAAELALGATEAAPVFVAANTVKHGLGETEELLVKAGLEPESLPLPGAFALAAPANLARSGLVGEADVLPADLSSQLVSHIAAVGLGGSLLEVGQGRGTKSVLLAAIACRMGEAASIVACEVDETKVRISKERMEAAGVAGDVECFCLDGRELSSEGAPEAVHGEFDAVFIDAPCSGTGTLRRHPEIAWSLTPEALDITNADSLPALQLALLQAAALHVRGGGTLTYATCSPLIQEDEAVIQAFLACEEGSAFEVASIEAAPGFAAAGEAGRDLILDGVQTDGTWRATGAFGSDYHFAVRLIKEQKGLPPTL